MPISIVIIILGIVQGLTEFLPVSSSGHLVLLNNIFGIENDIKALSILLHLATLISVIIYYRKELCVLLKHPFCKTNIKLVLTTLVTCIVVLILKPLIDRTFSGQYLFIFFTITAFLLILSDFLTEKQIPVTKCGKILTKSSKIPQDDIANLDISYLQCTILGVTQGIACIPGISRSGSTIATGKICGVKDPARYSFIMSIPIIIASLLMEIFEGRIVIAKSLYLPLIVSMIICAVLGYFCIKFVSTLSNFSKLKYFGFYLLALSSCLVIVSFL